RHVDRLGQVALEAGFLALADVALRAVAAQGDALDRALRTERAHQVVAGAVREADVADDDVETGVREPESGLDRVGDRDGVAQHPERLLDRRGAVGVVLDDEKTGLAVRGACRLRDLRRGRWRRHGAQHHLAARPGPGRVPDRDVPAVRIDDPLADREPEAEPGPPTRLAALLERLEEPRGDRRVDSDAG